MTYSSIIFDAFGTLLKIQNGKHPFRQVLKEGIRLGRRPKPDDARVLMTHGLGLRGAADHFGIDISDAELQRIQAELDEEVANIEPYPEAMEAILMLKGAGVHIAVCSNLAQPYGAAIRKTFPQLHAYGFSYEQGSAKPDAGIYLATCDLLGVTPKLVNGKSNIGMIGDSLSCDRDGPRGVGIDGYLLDRSGGTGFSNLVDFALFALAQPPGS